MTKTFQADQTKLAAAREEVARIEKFWALLRSDSKAAVAALVGE